MPPTKKKKENIPLMSMAGLVRYYEEEHEKVKIDPKVVIIGSIVVIGIVIALSRLVPI
ncbi:MAG: preprotein translocase subunit SecG [Candidatus Aramenus sulfurataquae]|jgi:preprotein translocase subunit Sec61beta|uniref:Preprotein translocase subunit SecG n=2 Tax=Candidatus Aramenus sulfurataquae TaxID=1326980 RepID=W7KM07_9CREN|nr:MAG: preprotein translocase subunit SecG [Candidatus Aramenus sulfurataquae]MBW9140519.1 preprotein translocase subunit Sec61beta [Candidatus Aramenus sp.]MCL7343383.1 preprotein translocase subunit Sec61beta [Candidatus Aramenus sulfurataquae]